MSRNIPIIVGFLFGAVFLTVALFQYFNQRSVTTPAPGMAPTVTPQALIQATPTKIISPTPTPGSVTRVKLFFIALDDNGKNGPKIGCGDSLIAVNNEISPTMTPLLLALTDLLSAKTQTFNNTGLYNSLYQSNLTIDSVGIDQNGVATVKLSGTVQLGGVCDSPRFEAQLRQTVLQFPTVKQANIIINNVPLEQVVSGR